MVMLKKKSKGKKISFVIDNDNFEKWEELKKKIESLGYEVVIDKELEKSFKKILKRLEKEITLELKEEKKYQIDTFEPENT